MVLPKAQRSNTAMAQDERNIYMLGIIGTILIAAGKIIKVIISK